MVQGGTEGNRNMVRFGSRGVQGEKGIWFGFVQGGSGGGRNMVRFGSRGTGGGRNMVRFGSRGFMGREEYG